PATKQVTDSPSPLHVNPAPSRRLAAVMLADVAGYSRMMERDEAGTHLQLREVRASVTDPAIERHHGRIVRTKGDDILVEFASAVEALSCAVEIQRAMAERNRDLAADSRIEFRIGINLGDILIDGGEIAGDGVNVAARLEALAAPGEVAISQAVREQVRQLVGVRLIDAGHHRVKNISRPIRVFKVSTDPRHQAGRLRRLTRRLRQPLAIGAGTLLVAGIAFVAWRLLDDGSARPFDPPRESLVVLPAAGGADAAGQRLADGLTRTVASALSQGLSGAVVAPSTASTTLAQGADPRMAGRQLNVRYALETTVLSAHDRVRIEARLVATDSGAQLWSSVLDADASNDGTPPAIVGRLAETVTSEVRRVELARAQAADTPPDAYFLTLRASADLPNATTPEAIEAVRQSFARALELQPEYGPALAGLASTTAYQAIEAPDSTLRSQRLAEADRLSQRAVAAAPNSATAWLVRAIVLNFRGELGAAAQAVERSLALNPYEDDAHAEHGRLLVATGRPEQALAAFDRALKLHPEGATVGVHLYNRCRAQLFLGRYQQAIDDCNRSIAFTPDWPDYMMLAAAYAQTGDLARAQQARDELLRRRPQFRLGLLHAEGEAMAPAAAQLREAHLIAGLRKAGVPD
ncbi:MAG: tetratricopeptide repeat protein, partial [Burkholderiaceae bacterium]|nr:tetratricopeptide repeat protein [Burkholderiaceae bacterium]